MVERENRKWVYSRVHVHDQCDEPMSQYGLVSRKKFRLIKYYTKHVISLYSPIHIILFTL